MADSLAGREVFVEIQTLGNLLRVTAIDALTGIEAVMSAPRQASRAEVERTILGKLRYVLEKNGHLASGEPSNRGPDPRGGTLA